MRTINWWHAIPRAFRLLASTLTLGFTDSANSFTDWFSTGHFTVRGNFVCLLGTSVRKRGEEMRRRDDDDKY
jgi:hypothetical protein